MDAGRSLLCFSRPALFLTAAALALFTSPSWSANTTPNGRPISVVGSDDERSISPAIAPWEDYQKHIKTRNAVATLGNDLFGDEVNLYTGALSFSQTDVSIPGNSGLEVAIRRRLSIAARDFQVPNDGSFADWDIDLPRIEGVYGLQGNGQVSWGTNRCSQTVPPLINVPGGNAYSALDYWSGLEASMPGGGELLLVEPSVHTTPRPPIVPGQPDWQWVTPNHTYLRCLDGVANDGGQGFLALTRDGTQYWFTRLAMNFEAPLDRPMGGYASDSGQLERRRVALYVTRVRDRFGHEVNYTYTNSTTEPIRLESIVASDGRTLHVSYVGNEIEWVEQRTAADGTRRWSYTYSGVAPRRVLQQVIQPDNSAWAFNLRQITDPDLLYDSNTTQFCNQPTYTGFIGVQGIVQPGQPQPPELPRSVSGTITHPSGAVGTFKVGIGWIRRDGVPRQCLPRLASRMNATVVESLPQIPLVTTLLQAQQKTIHGPGVAPMTWDYAFGSQGSWAGSACVRGGCLSGNTATVTGPSIDSVVGPAGREYIQTRFGNGYRTNEDTLLSVERGIVAALGGTPTILESTVSSYRLPPLTTFPTSLIGTSLRSRGDGYPSEQPRPQLTQTITRDGATFTTSFSDFDAFYRARQRAESSSLGHSRTETWVYNDDLTRWILDRVQSRTMTAPGGSPIVTESTTFDPATGLPEQIFRFGRLDRRVTYFGLGHPAGGLPSEVYDGSNFKRTNLSSYKRGIPQSVLYFDLSSESVVVNDFGDIRFHTDAGGGAPTEYRYDGMGRINEIIHPSENDGTQWHPTSVSFTQQQLSPAFGLPTGHWRRRVQTGSASAGYAVEDTYYDGLWRPVLTDTYETATAGGTPNAGSRRIAIRGFDYANRASYTSYPLRLASAYTDRPAGITQYYDALGRPTRSAATSELGDLVTQVFYQSPFVKRVRNPRGFETVYNFQAWGEPTDAYPVSIQQPQGITTQVMRDRFGKPVNVSRSSFVDGAFRTVNRHYVYDVNQRLCKRINPESAATIMAYDSASNIAWTAEGQNLLSTTSCESDFVPFSERITRSYDMRNRLTGIDYPGTTADIGVTYTPEGELQTVSRAGSTWTYTYYNRDNLPRTESLAYAGNTRAFTYGWTPFAHRASITYPDGEQVNHAPNRLGEASQVASSTRTYASNITWHPDGSVAGALFGNGVQFSRPINARQYPSQLSYTVGGWPRYTQTLTWDPNGNLSQSNWGWSWGTNAEQHDYDGVDRLVSTWAPGNYDGATYEYDAFDNIRRNVLGQSNASSGRDLRYEYNTSTNRLSGLGFPNGTTVAQYQHDPRGNLTRGLFYSGGVVASIVDFEYDRANTLQRITGLDPSIGEQRYRYDAHGHRIDVHTAVGQFNEARHWPVYTRDGTLRGEYRPASGAGAGPNDQYYYLGTQLISRRRGAADVSWFLTNHIGSNVATTDAFGNEIENSRFAPYGERHSKVLERGPAYAGHFEDATGITYMKARYYSGFMGVFLAIDPVDVDPATGGNFNRYAYANNNPFSFVDPDGRCGTRIAGGSAFNCRSVILNIPRPSHDPEGASGGGSSSPPSDVREEIQANNQRMVQQAAEDLTDAAEMAGKEAALMTVGTGISRFFGRVLGAVGRGFRGSSSSTKLFDKAGIATTEHFRNRLIQRASRGITERNALDAYQNGRLYYNPTTGTYIRHSSATEVSVVTDAPVGGRAITVFEGPASPAWIPVRWRPGQ